ncbi:hypothetical protein L6164_026820 [Bauhinia variegata]|uniref:Uncharacterized protein n=1 Tax=Bauhinia variegata TaxID=167791 RepID=A0ACB9LRJ3_BAUVA|nr:hypothetical protein L6164_026820 [Bauhinia variegata]
MKEISKLIILVLLLSFLSTILFITEAQARYINSYNCTASCGDVKNISYPFRLMSQPSSCGAIGYSLSCENKKTILEFGRGKYYVKSINYDQERIRVVDVNIADGNCSLPSQSPYADEVLDGYWAPLSNSETSFVNCSKPIKNSSFIQVPCMSGNGYITYAVYNSASMYDLGEKTCKLTGSMALSANDYNAKKPSSYEDIRKMLQNGFDLEWSIECQICLLTGGACHIYNDTSKQYRCYYSENFYLDYEIFDFISYIVHCIIDLYLRIRYIGLPLTCLTLSPYGLEVETQSDSPYASEIQTQSDSPTRVLIAKTMERSL